MMTASEFSRAESLSHIGGGKEKESCMLRAKELLGIMETDSRIPQVFGLKLLPILREMTNPFDVDPKSLYIRSMFLASE